MICELCGRDVDQLTEHHLKPRSRLRKKESTPTAMICSACHRQIHALFTNIQLAQDFNTLDKLQSEPRMARFLQWVRKQDPNRKLKVRR